MRAITALHIVRDGKPMSYLHGLPASHELMSNEDILDMARQLRECAIDAQRMANERPLLFGGNWHRGTGITSRHDMTPNYHEFPTFDESASFDPIGIDSEGGGHD